MRLSWIADESRLDWGVFGGLVFRLGPVRIAGKPFLKRGMTCRRLPREVLRGASMTTYGIVSHAR